MYVVPCITRVKRDRGSGGKEKNKEQNRQRGKETSFVWEEEERKCGTDVRLSLRVHETTTGTREQKQGNKRNSKSDKKASEKKKKNPHRKSFSSHVDGR